jgi:hypothetical protein
MPRGYMKPPSGQGLANLKQRGGSSHHTCTCSKRGGQCRIFACGSRSSRAQANCNKIASGWSSRVLKPTQPEMRADAQLYYLGALQDTEPDLYMDQYDEWCALGRPKREVEGHTQREAQHAVERYSKRHATWNDVYYDQEAGSATTDQTDSASAAESVRAVGNEEPWQLVACQDVGCLACSPDDDEWELVHASPGPPAPTWASVASQKVR